MRLLGHDLPGGRAAALARVGAIVEEPRFHGHLTGRENLHVHAAARDRAAHGRVDGALERVGLGRRGDDTRQDATRSACASGSAIARCLLCDPELLVLDEPVNGLDPAGILEFRGLVRSLVDEGRTVWLSSHLLDEVREDLRRRRDRRRRPRRRAGHDRGADRRRRRARSTSSPRRGPARPGCSASMRDVVRAAEHDGALRVELSPEAPPTPEMVTALLRRLLDGGIEIERVDARHVLAGGPLPRHDHPTGGPILMLDLRLIRAEILKLRRRRGLMAWTAVLTFGAVALCYAASARSARRRSRAWKRRRRPRAASTSRSALLAMTRRRRRRADRRDGRRRGHRGRRVPRPRRDGALAHRAVLRPRARARGRSSCRRRCSPRSRFDAILASVLDGGGSRRRRARRRRAVALRARRGAMLPRRGVASAWPALAGSRGHGHRHGARLPARPVADPRPDRGRSATSRYAIPSGRDRADRRRSSLDGVRARRWRSLVDPRLGGGDARRRASGAPARRRSRSPPMLRGQGLRRAPPPGRRPRRPADGGVAVPDRRRRCTLLGARAAATGSPPTGSWRAAAVAVVALAATALAMPLQYVLWRTRSRPRR